MKLLFTFFNPSGGMDTLNRIRGKALKERQMECHLLYSIDGEGRRNIKGIPTYISNEEAFIGRLIERERYDAIVVCTDITMLMLMRKVGFKGPIIFEVQGLGTMKMAHAILKDISARVLQTADAVLYPQTNHLRELMQEHLPGIRHFCFDNPLDTKGFVYIALPPKRFPIIGWVGRIEENKNWKDFLFIGARLVNLYPEAYLWIFGDLSLGDSLEKVLFDKWVDGLKLREKLIIHPNVPHDQMASYFSIIGDSGGLLLSTSIMEGFGYAVAEAMLCRCPVLATDSDGIRRFLAHDVTGKQYPRSNIDQAVVEAQSLMRNVPLRNSIIDQAEMHIKAHFSCNKYATNFIRMLRDLKVISS